MGMVMSTSRIVQGLGENNTRGAGNVLQQVLAGTVILSVPSVSSAIQWDHWGNIGLDS